MTQTRRVWDCQSGLPISWDGFRDQLIGIYGSPMECLGDVRLFTDPNGMLTLGSMQLLYSV